MAVGCRNGGGLNPIDSTKHLLWAEPNRYICTYLSPSGYPFTTQASSIFPVALHMCVSVSTFVCVCVSANVWLGSVRSSRTVQLWVKIAPSLREKKLDGNVRKKKRINYHDYEQ